MSRKPGSPVSIVVWAITTVLAFTGPATGPGQAPKVVTPLTHATLVAPPVAPPAASAIDPARPRPGERSISPVPMQRQPVCDWSSLRPMPLPPPGRMPARSTMERIAQRGFLLAGVDQNTLMFGHRDAQTGQLDGFEIDLVRAIAQAIFGDPNRVQFRPVPVAQRIALVRDNAVDLVANTLTITCARRAQVEFSAPYYVANQRILVQKGSGISGLADLAGKRVCAARGSTSLRRLLAAPQKPVPVGLANAIDCLVALQRGEVDAISTDDTLLAGMAMQDPRTEIVGERLGQEPYGIAINPREADLARFVNAVLERWIADGSWAESHRRWLSALGPPPPPPVPKYRE